MRQVISILFIVLSIILFGCDGAQNKVTQINPVDELAQVDKLLSEIAEKPQQLSASSDKVSTVIGSKGTIIHVDPSRLETVDGSALGDNIQIELLELTDNSAMLLNNTQTTSNGQILVTGGAYYLNMTSDGKQLKMKQGKGLEVEFPKLTDSEMGLYTGERDSLGQMNWIETTAKFESTSTNDTSMLKNNSKSDAAPSKPTKPLEVSDQDDRVLTVVFEDTMLIPELKEFNNVSFRVNDDCDYNPNDGDKFWTKVSISKSEDDGEYLISFEGFSKAGKKTTRKYEVTPVLEGSDYKTALKRYEDKYNKYTAYQKQKAEKQAEKEFQRKTYGAIELLNFGWINCDRLLNDASLRTDIQILVTNDSLSGARIYAVFKDSNSIVTAYYFKDQKETTAFRNIPRGQELSIIALSSQNETPYMFESTINTETDSRIQVNFAPTTHAEIKERMMSMN
jgi:hypothetical protein